VPLRESLKKALPRVNAATELAGIHIEPLHYYSNIADRRWLRSHRSLWQRPVQPRGIEWDLDAQLDWLRPMTAAHVGEVVGLEAYRAASTGVFGPGYGPIESQVLYCFLRAQKPRRMIEVGCGVSTATAVAASATNANEGAVRTAVTCIEPFARAGLRELPDIDLWEIPCQEVPLETFTQLSPGDLLFIDSTHAVRTGSELPYLYLEVLPSLAAGVFIHIHDIYLPFLFSPFVLGDPFDWQETVVLAALLTNNDHLRVRCCLSALHHERQADLRSLLPDYWPAPTPHGLATAPLGSSHFPSSIWLETA